MPSKKEIILKAITDFANAHGGDIADLIQLMTNKGPYRNNTFVNGAMVVNPIGTKWSVPHGITWILLELDSLLDIVGTDIEHRTCHDLDDNIIVFHSSQHPNKVFVLSTQWYDEVQTNYDELRTLFDNARIHLTNDEWVFLRSKVKSA